MGDRISSAVLCRSVSESLYYREVNAQMALCAMIVHVLVVIGLDRDPMEVISTGDRVRVSADQDRVEIKKK
jgi:hypothetical protein